MSLLIWLPLNGNLENYGLLPAKFSMVNTSGGLAMSTAGGKTAYGYQRNTVNTADYITSDISFALNGDYSMCCWCKITNYGTNDSANGIITHHGHLTGGGGITMRYVSATDYRMSINTGINSNDRTYKTFHSTTNIYNSWHHLCMTYERSKQRFRMYIDGKIEIINRDEVPQGQYITYGDTVGNRPFRLFDWSTDHSTNSAYRPKCQLNDVRLYDHCLSPREIEEIAQGLIAHWPLRDKINDNLITTMESGGRTTLNGKYGINADYSQNLDTYAWFNVNPALESGKTYTLSFDVENFPEDGASWEWWLWNNSACALTVNKNGHYSYTFTPPSSFSTNQSLSHFLFDDGTKSLAANMVYFSNFKIEEGDVDTAWCPHSTDTASPYIKPIYLMDCGGQGYNVSQVGSTGSTYLRAAKDSARNSSCLYFNAGKSYYLKNDSCYFPYEAATMSCWFKGTPGVAGASNYHIPFSSDGNRFEISLEGTAGALRGGFVIAGTRKCYTTSKTTNDGKWHMLTITYDGSHIRYYVDAEEISGYATAVTGSLAGGKQLVAIGHYGTNSSYGNVNCYMSDVRLYATALSPKAIKDLYQATTYFTTNDHFCAYEFVEKDKTQLEEGGIVCGNLASNIPLHDMKIKILNDGSVWARILWHDVTNSKTWFTSSEVKECLNAQNKYSRMGLVDQFKTIEGIYEFMLTYPKLSTTAHNRWQQTSSPEEGTVTGYTPIRIDWGAHSGGIRKHGSSSYWNCDTGSTWYAALGQYQSWTSTQYIPAADGSSQTETELWVRIDNLLTYPVVTKMYPNMIASDNFYEI